MPKISPPSASVLVVLAVLLAAVLVARQMIVASRPPGQIPRPAVLRGVYTLPAPPANVSATPPARSPG